MSRLFWCRCTVRSACQKATTSSPRWLAYGSGQQCIDFEQVLPDRIPITQTAVVSLFSSIIETKNVPSSSFLALLSEPWVRFR